ncbi:hypothetical protein ACFV28_13395 [Streptomyces sp. NPDC059720]|uniref:hypothetical protein n=1 Tax=Streptomyces sp. NPDC059720 TaxID=3346924 RepID=UPI0036845EF9
MNVTIPGALADHLADEIPLDLDTRAALDAGRRGRGRTLVIEPKNVTALHVISRRAEYLLGNAYATDAQKRAARTWLKRAGHAPTVVTFRYEDTQTAYNATQCTAEFRDGDVLIVEAEQVVGFLYGAWPATVTEQAGHLHAVEGDPRTLEGRYAASVRTALDLARELGFALDPDAIDDAPAEQAVEDDAPTICPESVTVDPDDLIADEWRTAAQLVTEADATDGTWQGAWIGEQTTTTAPALFPLDAEQGALFDDRAAADTPAPAAVEGEFEWHLTDGIAVIVAGTVKAPSIYHATDLALDDLNAKFEGAATAELDQSGDTALIITGPGQEPADGTCHMVSVTETT